MMPRVRELIQRQSLQQAVTNWGVILVGLLLHNGLSAITLFIVAREVHPDAYGQYVAVYALLSFLVVLPGLGLDTWLLAQYLPTREQFTAYWQQSLRLRSVALLLWLGLMGLLGFALPHDTYPWALWLPTAVGVACDSFSLLSFSALRTQNRHKLVTVWQAIFAVALFAFALWLPNSENYLVTFANGRMALSLLLALLILIYRFRNYQTTNQQRPLANGEVLRQGRPFMLAELASAVYVRADVSIVSLILGKSATALYGPAINLLQASFLAPRALFLLILPLLSKTFKRDLNKFNRQGIVQIGIQGAVGGLISIALFLFADELLTLIFQEAYLGSARYLKLLSPIPFLRALNFGVGTMLAASERQTLNTRVQIVVAGFNVAANLIFILPFGLAGVSVVYVVSDTILLLATSYLLWRSSKQLPKHPQ
ncbi:lipopolysaccharide biosynthesis protein [Candidatus Leptofilum sp.]|uniref:lipopolysaccharide biosynthesis protein n=1 Tax=Candidatus Leptofilum sp. TaxID=3241576 RepID=UPI003B5CA814